MKKAGIKVWVLTGDKVGTSTAAAYDAGVLDITMRTHTIRESADEDITEQLKALERKV